MAKTRNASASKKAWDFQFNAAIILTLSHITDVDQIKVEGESEDIELYLNDNSVILSQAKFVEIIDDYRNVLRNLIDALSGLNKESISTNVTKTIYITNTPNPLNNMRTVGFYSGFKNLEFKELPSSDQKKIENIISKSKLSELNLDRLEIWILPFHGTGDNLFSSVREQLYYFLEDIEETRGIGNKLLKIWQNKYSENASHRKVKIKKKELVWPIIVLVCENPSIDVYLDGIDPAVQSQLRASYAGFMNTMTEKFEFANKVISTYNEQVKSVIPLEKDFDDFIENNWTDFLEDFKIPEIEESHLEVIAKLIIRNILTKRFVIQSVKGKVNL